MDAKTLRMSPATGVQKRQDQAMPSAAQAAADADGAGADVQLTGAARNLAAIEQSLRAMPAVDELRVTAVRQRLESGDYQVDPQRVADKLLHLEGELQRGNPIEHSVVK